MGVSLSQRHCMPCEGGTPLSAEQVRALLAQLPGWKLREGGTRIGRKVRFKDFAQALAFVNRVGGVAEAQGHHPDIAFGWGYADITLYTHSISGLHENDFIMAAKIEALL